MVEEQPQIAEPTRNYMEGQQADEEQGNSENNSLHRPLLKRNLTLSSSPLALVGAKVSHMDYKINENDLFKQDWRNRSKVQVMQYIFLKWTVAFLVGLLTGVIATLINLAIENIAGYKKKNTLQATCFLNPNKSISGNIQFVPYQRSPCIVESIQSS